MDEQGSKCEVCSKNDPKHWFCNNCVRKSKIYNMATDNTPDYYEKFVRKCGRREFEITADRKCDICPKNSFIYYFISICEICRKGDEGEQ